MPDSSNAKPRLSAVWPPKPNTLRFGFGVGVGASLCLPIKNICICYFYLPPQPSLQLKSAGGEGAGLRNCDPLHSTLFSGGEVEISPSTYSRYATHIAL